MLQDKRTCCYLPPIPSVEGMCHSAVTLGNIESQQGLVWLALATEKKGIECDTLKMAVWPSAVKVNHPGPITLFKDTCVLDSHGQC